MLELQGKELPNSTVLGIIPQKVTFDIALSQKLYEAFDGYIKVALKFLKDAGIDASKKEKIVSLDEIIEKVKDPSGAMT
jgi:hypothetical protein